MEIQPENEMNKRLKQEFKKLNLNLADVWAPTPENIELENKQLYRLLDWVLEYRKCPDRQSMEKKGYDYPPIEPDINPDNDWLIFETWVKGKPVSWKYENLFGSIPPVGTLSEEALIDGMTRMLDRLSERGVEVSYKDKMPLKLAYEDLRNYLQKENFTILEAGTRSILDCISFCPECVRRPWCDLGQGELEGWPEDINAGTMVVPDICKPYMSGNMQHTPFSVLE